MTAGVPWRATRDGIALRVRLTPRAAKDAVEGIGETAEGPAVLARVRAVPSEGEANTAVARLVAEWLGVPKSAVSVAAGGKSRIKTLAIAGDPAALEKLLAARLSAA
jgi:uncharacterized protein